MIILSDEWAVQALSGLARPDKAIVRDHLVDNSQEFLDFWPWSTLLTIIPQFIFNREYLEKNFLFRNWYLAKIFYFAFVLIFLDFRLLINRSGFGVWS